MGGWVAEALEPYSAFTERRLAEEPFSDYVPEHVTGEMPLPAFPTASCPVAVTIMKGSSPCKLKLPDDTPLPGLYTLSGSPSSLGIPMARQNGVTPLRTVGSNLLLIRGRPRDEIHKPGDYGAIGGSWK